MAVTVTEVVKKSPAHKKGVKNGDKVLAINGNNIIDVLDYRFYQNDSRLELKIETVSGKVKTIKIKKGEYEDLGLEFQDYLMDKQHSCQNNCVFCFINQLPSGMRESLYFKDDDSRLSFLFGNYITLTNLTEHEINRIIKMHISPVNISVHTTNPELRCKMMNNRFAGEKLEIISRFNQAGIKMNCQLVLVPGLNDGEELERSLADLLLYENVESIAAVPVGITKYREGLPKLNSFNKETAQKTLDILNKFGEKSIQKYGVRKVFGSDEFYLLAEQEIPNMEFYEDFSQLDNGVGMWALLKDETFNAINQAESLNSNAKKTIATGVLAYPLLNEIVNYAKNKFSGLNCNVYAIKNNFFGEKITVSGLVTGSDLIEQLKDKDIGEILLLPENMLRYENDLFLDNVSVAEVEEKLGVKVVIVSSGGEDLIEKILN